MATYKNGHKKISNDKFISNILIGFAVSFFVLVVAILLFKAFDNSIELNVSNLTEMKEDQYVVYFYSDTCSACIAIRDEVAAFKAGNNADIKLYYLDSANVSQNDYSYLNSTFGIGGTPAMLTIVNGVVVDVNAGSLDITNIFDAINSGTYTLIN